MEYTWNMEGFNGEELDVCDEELGAILDGWDELGLDEWERGFVLGVGEKNWLSGKEKSIVSRIYFKYVDPIGE